MSEQDNPEKTTSLPSWIKVNPPVFFGAGGLCLLFVLFAVRAPTTAETVFSGVQNWVALMVQKKTEENLRMDKLI